MSGYRMFGNSSVFWLHLTFLTVYGSVLSIMDNFSKYLAFVTLYKLSKYDNFSIVCLPRWRRVGVTKYSVTQRELSIPIEIRAVAFTYQNIVLVYIVQGGSLNNILQVR